MLEARRPALCVAWMRQACPRRRAARSRARSALERARAGFTKVNPDQVDAGAATAGEQVGQPRVAVRETHGVERAQRCEGRHVAHARVEHGARAHVAEKEAAAAVHARVVDKERERVGDN